MHRFGLAATLILAASGGTAETSDCQLVSLMRLADSQLRARMAGNDVVSAEQIASALNRIASEGAEAAARGSLPGLNVEQVAAFVNDRRRALFAGEAVETVLPQLQRSMSMVNGLARALECSLEGRDVAAEADASAAAHLSTAAVSDPGDGWAAGGLDATRAALRGDGAGRAGAPASMPRALTPFQAPARDYWMMLSVFLLVTSSTVTLINRHLRRQRRRERRHACALDILLDGGRGPETARVVDLSCLGAKLRLTQTPPDIGEKRVLHLSGRACTGRVVWANTHFAGINFDRPLSIRACADILGFERPDDLDDETEVIGFLRFNRRRG